MSDLASVAESRILESLEAGDEITLAGKGQPLNLDAYFAAPSSLRAGFGMLKSAGVVPPEVEAMRSVGWLRERLTQVTNDTERESLRQELMVRETELAMALERMKRSLKTDAAG
ncbi:MAG TPA: DnaJ family domain-containing protein [Candidatus Saccharimonadia bacterium]|nr:DnaJ family domain-containing protein [Candidatus Saccharimonadia bacterium]